MGQLLVVRSRPLRMTEPGKVLLRYARQLQALRADAARELGATQMREERLPIAINADSLATWVLGALDALVHAGQREGYGLELIVDDQDFTHDRLREGEVLGCVSHRLAWRCAAAPASRWATCATSPSPARPSSRRRCPPASTRPTSRACPSSCSTARTTCRRSGWRARWACAIRG